MHAHGVGSPRHVVTDHPEPCHPAQSWESGSIFSAEAESKQVTPFTRATRLVVRLRGDTPIEFGVDTGLVPAQRFVQERPAHHSFYCGTQSQLLPTVDSSHLGAGAVET